MTPTTVETEVTHPTARGRLRWFRKFGIGLVRLWNGEVVAEHPSSPREAEVSRRMIVYGLVLVAVALAIVELAFALSPIPPGVDSGDWIQRSYGWVGLAHPPEDAVGSPFLYNPLLFPLLGATVLLTGSPITAGFLFAGLLLVAYGLSVLHLARRFLLSGPFQVLFVGLALLNGTTLQILFWGGYPNFLAFVFFNEALVFLLAFSRSRSLRDSLLFYAMAALLFLTHDLTFAIFLATLLLVALLLLAQDRRWFGLIASRANVAGAALLAATVAGYDETIGYLHIVHPGYFSSNPAAYLIDNIGELFRPLGSAPMFFSSGPGVDLSPLVVGALLVVAGVGVVVGLLTVARVRPSWLDVRHTFVTAAVAGVLLVPVGGYAMHIATDYTRFVYFLALPVGLLVSLILEDIFLGLGRTTPSRGGTLSGGASSRLPVRFRYVRAPVAERYALVGVGIVLVLLVANVSVPTAITNERLDSGLTHDAAFLQMSQWLAKNPQAGSVVTTQGAVRWIEALTNRGAFDIGPTWLLFEPWQIVNAQQTFFALNSRYAVTNNVQALSFSGFNSTTLNQAPMYTAIIQGVEFPILRIPSTSIYANVSMAGGGFEEVPVYSVGTASLRVPGPTVGSGTVLYAPSSLRAEVIGSVDPGGISQVTLTVAPNPGFRLTSISLSLANPPTGTSFLHLPSSTGVHVSGATIFWNDSGVLGQLPGRYAITTRVMVAPLPESTAVSSLPSSNSVGMVFANPAPSQPLSLSFTIVTEHTSNPAVALPAFFDSAAFLAEHHIHYVVVPNQPGFASTAALFESLYGYAVTFENDEWMVLQG